VYSIGIIGLGLIGGSLALALNKYLSAVEIKGFDKNADNLDYALKNSMIDCKLTKDNIINLDIIFIAVPVKSIQTVLREYYSLLKVEKTLVTDMGSTKSYIHKKISSSFPNLKYIGGHPLAGKEVSGPRGAEADLFTGKKYILIKQEQNNDVNEVIILTDILKKIGCNVIFMSPQEHDRFLAFSSHLPQVLSTSLMVEYIDFEKENREIADLIGTGFLDMTRIAASDPHMWVDIFLTNKKNIINNIDKYIAVLNNFKQYINNDDKEEIFNVMIKAGEKREEI